MEAAVANLLSPGDKALAITVGAFGERFIKIARRFEVDVEVMAFPYGQAADPEAVAKRLERDREGSIKAILVQHNETSTGVLNDIRAISEARGGHPALLVVDTISGLLAADLPVDSWKVDVAIAGSQKAFMVPPGLAMLSLSRRAWEAVERCTNRRYYFDLLAAREQAARGFTPYTPAVSLLYGLEEALRMVAEETLAGSFRRHALLRDMVRAGVKALDLELLAGDEVASPSVTAVKVPEGLKPADIISPLRERHGVIVAAGQGEVKDRVFRIGHLGYVTTHDILTGLSALEDVLALYGLRPRDGAGVAAALRVYEESRAS